MTDCPPDLEPLVEIEQEIVSAAKNLRILGALAWPRQTIDAFLDGWRRGAPALPKPEIRPPPGLDAMVDTMAALMRRTPREHPVGDLLWRTAWSYHTAARMLLSVGRPAFLERSVELYGRPDRMRETQSWSDLDAAEYLLEKSAELLRSCAVPDATADIPADALAAELSARIAKHFPEDAIAVEVVDDLASKAAASSERVRLRRSAMFTELDLDQLFEHEVMVHSATMLNGKRQPYFDVLGLAAPRTTRHQEGLATLAEMLTNAMDLMRLRRIALRVRGIAMALDGADFLDVFRMFLDEGQGEEESAQSAMRVFRGGDPRGRVIFTKDGTYIGGLFEVHTFLRVAVRDGRPELIPHLFSGRLTLKDTVDLHPAFEDGVFVGPRYMPTWAADLRRLTATLSYSAFTSMVDLRNVHVDVFSKLEDRVIDESLEAPG